MIFYAMIDLIMKFGGSHGKVFWPFVGHFGFFRCVFFFRWNMGRTTGSLGPDEQELMDHVCDPDHGSGLRTQDLVCPHRIDDPPDH